MSEIDLGLLQSWIGRKEQGQDVIARKPAAQLAALLDCERLPEVGETLPPLWHWAYFTPLAKQSELGKDGHPRLGGFMPPIPLPRRMWAGGRLRFFAPMYIGDSVTRETEIIKITLKSRERGSLVFVTLRHRLSTTGGLSIEEEQDLVYRGPSPQAAAAPAVSADAPPAAWREPMRVDPRLLFRYSAVTFNTHRIHYDATYATEEEGYRALVVHGPLTATLLAQNLAAHVPGRLKEFEFRGQRPLIVDQQFNLCGFEDGANGYKLWAETAEGVVAMSAKARLESAS